MYTTSTLYLLSFFPQWSYYKNAILRKKKFPLSQKKSFENLDNKKGSVWIYVWNPVTCQTLTEYIAKKKNYISLSSKNAFGGILRMGLIFFAKYADI